ncbi:MAG: hypothetical protein HDS68_06950 [Bacteroidales bacterium]|nr:hypothetical protein [Bacteroidales bacterium]
MNRTKLDEKSMTIGFDPYDYDKEEKLWQLIQEGYDYTTSDGCMRWIRKYPDETKFNSFNCTQLLDFQKKWLEFQQIPGHLYNPVSQEGYNAFARWNEWFGAYVAGLGYVGEPSSSSYGAQLYLNGSWVSPGTSDFPMTTGNFYKKAAEHTWSGGQVDTWGYVKADQRILGVSTDMGFAYGEGDNDTLVTLANFCRMLSWDPVEVNDIRSDFQEYRDQNTSKYEIPARAIAKFLDSRFSVAYASSISEALRKHYGVLLRIVTRTEEVNAQINKYGEDYLIVGYNPILQQLDYITRAGGVGALSLEKVVFSETVTFFYKRH